MKIYVIGKYEAKEEIRKILVELALHGHEITCDWTTGEDATQLSGQERLACLRRAAEADRAGAREADAVIVLHHDQLCGGLVEVGIALASGKPVLVVDDPQPTARRQPIFYWLPEVRFFESVGGAIRFVDAMAINGWR